MRSAEEVIRDHLELAETNSLQEDLKRNFSEATVLLTSFGIFRGLSGIHEKAKLLFEHLPNGKYVYEKIYFDGPMGFLKWSGTSPTGNYVDDGADSYYVENDKIRVMTIHYTVKKGE